MAESQLYNRLFKVSFNRILVVPNDTLVQNVTADTSDLLKWLLNTTNSPKYEYYASQEDAESAYKANNTGVTAGIIFNYNHGGNLSYAIRIPYNTASSSEYGDILADQSGCRNNQNDETGIKIPNGLVLDGCNVNKYVYNGFVALQNALDTVLIRRTVGNNKFPVPNVSIQMMPKPAFVPDASYIQILSSIYFVIAYSPLVNFLTVRLVSEKEKKIKEGMRMMGMRDSAFWLSWGIVYTIILAIITSIVLIIAIAVGFFVRSNYFLFFLMLFLYGLSIIGFSFAMTPLFNKARVAGVVAGVATQLISLLYLIISLTRKYDNSGGASYTIPVAWRYVLSLFSPVALALSIDQGIFLDITVGMNFETASSKGDFPLASSMTMLAVDVLLYFFLAVYLDNVVPGEYGPRYPPWFIFTKSYWCPLEPKKGVPVLPLSTKYGRDQVMISRLSSADSSHEDIEPVSEEVQETEAVRISNLTKEFKGEDKEVIKAINGLSLTIYEDQITALLGHNGAGKTTTMNILCGLIGPTSGYASILGYDVSKARDMSQIRGMTGVCPQHNILFDELTCVEHLNLFAVIKGVPPEHVEQEVKTALKNVDLEGKENVESEKLSGGQKRKLSLAIALIGDPKIIFLDEPTAGMDPYSRRHIWSLLQEKKAGRVILLTTHFMDEADILADRKAIISKGHLRCCGSSLFLKNKFGIGYHLNMVMKPACDVDKVRQAVSSYVPTAQVSRIHGKELSMILPLHEVDKFAEGDHEDINLSDLSEGMKYTSHGNKDNPAQNSITSGNSSEVDNELTTSNEFTRIFSSSLDKDRPASQRFWAMFRLRFLQNIRSKTALAFQLIIPVMLVILGLVLNKVLQKGVNSNANNPNALPIYPVYYARSSFIPNQKSLYGPTPALLINNSAGSMDISHFLGYISQIYETENFSSTASLLQNYPHYLGLDLRKLDFNMTTLNCSYLAEYNDSAIHAIPAIINLMSNSLLKAAENLSGITASNATIGVTSLPWPSLEQKRGFDSAAYSSSLVLALAFVLIASGFGIDVVQDRQVKARSQLRISGVPVNVYWATFCLMDLIKFSISVLLTIIVVLIAQVESLKPGGAMLCLILVSITYVMDNILFSYVFSFLFSKTESAMAIQPTIIITVGMIGYVTVSLIDLLAKSSTASVLHYVLVAINPPYGIFGGIYYIDRVYREALVEQRTDSITVGDYFKFGNNIVITFLMPCLHIIIWFFVLQMLDIKTTGGKVLDAFPCLGQERKLHDSDVFDNVNLSIDESNEDDDVTEERKRVLELQHSNSATSAVTIVTNLNKEFEKEDKKPCQACRKGKVEMKTVVQNVSFAVDEGEVFGLLGPNGAGKTTTLNMITAEVGPTSGKVIVGGHDIKSCMSDAFQAMGYCPQHDALWETITLREHLQCYAGIRGMNKENIPKIIDFFLENLKLQEHADKPSKELSGGTKRKLCFAISMLGNPKLVLLDEPSTGMDPQSKRFFWDTICASFQDSDRGAILTTHYMEEADALCSRICIMVNGKMECIGSGQHLKMKYGSGYLLEVKLKQQRQTGQRSSSTDTVLPGNVSQSMQKLDDFIHNLFPQAKCLECFGERAQFKIPMSDVQSLGKVFSVLEQGKRDHDIEEYSFSQSTLEQVFLEFANKQLDESETETNREEERKQHSTIIRL
ncbi:hypothetical protein CHS0354_004209 [Potamilus streckersoni]|uniref:ABC transporter domain-containing protein n=1 Tax=Potamilus streckersoni TaxID=2493646 RepID=A0AAE0RRM8_9BIVA|nr:hypothetical protein CHS0354_004209 [Potamilus streckersoni]